MKFIRAFEAPHTALNHLDPADQQILQVLEQDWRTIAAQKQMKGRFDPALMDAALPHAFMLERTGPGALRIRVAGQRLHDLLRMDPRGMTFGTFFTEDSRDTAMRLAETAFAGPAIVSIPLSAYRGIARRPLRAQVLLLPLRDSGGELTRVMGALVVSGQSGNRGLRFDVATDQPLRCDLLDSPYPERRARRGQPVVPPMPTGNPGLRLVVNNT